MTIQSQVWLTATEAAQHLKVEARTLLMWARQGKVKGYVLSGTRRQTWRFLHVDLDAMLAAPSVARRKGGFNESTERDGSVVLDKRIKVWNFFFWENGKRRSKKIGTRANIPRRQQHGGRLNHYAIQ